MKIGFSLSGAVCIGDQDIYAHIKRMGYDCIDYDTLANTARHPAYALDEAEFKELFINERKRIEAAGLTVFQTHGPWRYPALDGTPEERAERFEKMSRAIYATRLLGSRYFIIHPIMPFGAESDESPEKVWEMNLDFMTRLTEVGKAHGVVVCLENMPMLKFPISKPDTVLEMVKEINSPFMRMCLDTGHCSVHDGLSPAAAVRMIGKEHLATLHVHDNDGTGDRHWPPYTGVIDWEDFRRALYEIGFDGALSLETSIDEMMHLPEELRGYYEKGLVLVAEYLAAEPKKLKEAVI